MPRSQSQPPASETVDLPGFRDPGVPLGDHPDESSQSPDQSGTSLPPATSHSPLEGYPDAASAASSPGSTEPGPDEPPPRPQINISGELREELENFSGGVFELAGYAANRFVRMRTRTNTRLWLVTEEEAEDFGAAAGRIVARRVPEELSEGDGADALIMGSVVLGYAMRNMTGIAAPEPGAQEQAEPVQQAAQTPPPPPAQPAAPPASVTAPGGATVVGVEAATPPPPFSPDL